MFSYELNFLKLHSFLKIRWKKTVFCALQIHRNRQKNVIRMNL